MTFRALNNRVLWNTTELSERECRYLLGLYLDEGAVEQYWDLHDAMTEAGMIPARPVETPDLTYSPEPVTAWVESFDEGCAA